MSAVKIEIDAKDIHATGVWRLLPAVGLVLGVVGTAASFLLRGENPANFYFSWLTAFVFFLSLALGGLFFVIAHFLTKAGWSVALRRIAENMMIALPVFIVLFVPVVLGMHDLYHWTHADAVAEDPLLQHKQPWLNERFFLVRSAAYLAIWALMAVTFYRLSTRQDRTGEPQSTRWLQNLSAPGMFLFAVTATLAAVDWVMTLDPHWYSTIFGVYFFAGAVLGCYAFMTLTLLGLRRSGLMRSVVNAEHFHDMGKLIFAFVVFWAYIGFSQYFLIWYGNIPEETLWFIHRHEGSWLTVTRALAIGHFVLPFLFLLPRTIKRNTTLLAIGALWVLVFHYLDIYWLIMPVLDHHGVHPSLMNLTTLLGVGGFFLAAFGWALRRTALLPARDPRLPESLSFENV